MARKLGWKSSGRDGNRHVALPFVVLESVAYRGLGYAARALLIDIAKQYNGLNNGKLVGCSKYLAPLGWVSADTVTRAKRDLLESGLLIETRKGWRPNRAAWYALAWYSLNQSEGLDIDPTQFDRIRGGYRAALIPIPGVVKPKIAPKFGIAA